MANFKKWIDTNSFHEVVKAINYRKYSEWLETKDNKLEYYAKIKLHGTNASVTITPEGKVIAAKRSSFLPDGGIGGDNAGFAAWVKSREECFLNMVTYKADVTLYGEWCGPGIQNNVACSSTGKKYFYIFAVDYKCYDEIRRIYNPDEMERIIGSYLPDEALILPYHCRVEFNFKDAEGMRTTLDNINQEVEEIGKCDPFIKEIFEVEGPGEGLVFYPTIGEMGIYDDTNNDLEFFSVFAFKAKSEEHRVNKTKKAVSANPEVIATQKKFAEMFCTEARFEQAFVEAVDREINIKRISDFIKWCCLDVMKESATERESLDLPWEKLSKVVTTRAATWYKNKCQMM